MPITLRLPIKISNRTYLLAWALSWIARPVSIAAPRHFHVDLPLKLSRSGCLSKQKQQKGGHRFHNRSFQVIGIGGGVQQPTYNFGCWLIWGGGNVRATISD